MIFQILLSSSARKLASLITFLGILLPGCVLAAGQTPGATSLSTKAPQASHPGDISAIQHIVFIIKENRTFDHYFGTYPFAANSTAGELHIASGPLRNR